MEFLLAFLGAGFGGVFRHATNLAVTRLLGFPSFPVGTMLINITGSLAMGVMAEYLALRGHLPQHARLFLTTGVLGGYTTFSAFSLDAALLYERGQLAACAMYVVGSVIVSIAALFLGLLIVRQVS